MANYFFTLSVFYVPACLSCFLVVCHWAQLAGDPLLAHQDTPLHELLHLSEDFTSSTYASRWVYAYRFCLETRASPDIPWPVYDKTKSLYKVRCSRAEVGEGPVRSKREGGARIMPCCFVKGIAYLARPTQPAEKHIETGSSVPLPFPTLPPRCPAVLHPRMACSARAGHACAHARRRGLGGRPPGRPAYRT